MNSNSKIKKAVVPVAGLGTRFLPATKSIPKEMLPIVDRPIILHIAEECVQAGIEQLILISGRGKESIENFFDISFELEHQLEVAGKSEWLEQVANIRNQLEIISIRQQKPLGLGHAVLKALPIVGNEYFAVLLGDEITKKEPHQLSAIGQLILAHETLSSSVVAIMEVPRKEVVKYGIISGERASSDDFIKVSSVVEKPSPEQAPTTWALPGRYVFHSQIFDHLKEINPGKNGEIQLTDAMTRLAKSQGLWATEVTTHRFDAGDKFGYLQANIEFGLEHPEIGQKLKAYLQEKVKEW